MKLLLVLLKLYPRAWRERYEEEMIALLEEHTITLFTLIDLFFGALDARLDSHYRTQRMHSVSDPVSRIRLANIAILCIILLFWTCRQVFLSEMVVYYFTIDIASILLRIAFSAMIVATLASFAFARKTTPIRNAILNFLSLVCFLFTFISYCLVVNNGPGPTDPLVLISELLVGLFLTLIIITRGKISKKLLLPSFVLTTSITVCMVAQIIDVAYWSSSLLQYANMHYLQYVYSTNPTSAIHSSPFVDRMALLTVVWLGSMALLTLVAVFMLLRCLLALISTRKAAPKEEMVQTMPPLMQ